jgi:serine/threonine-protein kinase
VRRFALALVIIVSAAGPAVSGAWQTHVNERFGTTADVPADWQAGEPPANGDGLRFTSPDGSASVTVFGGLQTFDTIDETVAIYETLEEGEAVTYRHRDDRGLVISGTVGDRIFYRRWILSCGDAVWNGLSIEYPAAEKGAYDALVTHMSRSLRPGQGWQVEDCPD